MKYSNKVKGVTSLQAMSLRKNTVVFKNAMALENE
jgi:hypothetical protein